MKKPFTNYEAKLQDANTTLERHNQGLEEEDIEEEIDQAQSYKQMFTSVFENHIIFTIN